VMVFAQNERLRGLILCGCLRVYWIGVYCIGEVFDWCLAVNSLMRLAVSGVTFIAFLRRELQLKSSLLFYLID
jgi:hypothetical protein